MTDTKTKDEFSLEEDDLFEDFDIVGMLRYMEYAARWRLHRCYSRTEQLSTLHLAVFAVRTYCTFQTSQLMASLHA